MPVDLTKLVAAGFTTAFIVGATPLYCGALGVLLFLPGRWFARIENALWSEAQIINRLFFENAADAQVRCWEANVHTHVHMCNPVCGQYVFYGDRPRAESALYISNHQCTSASASHHPSPMYSRAHSYS